MDTTLATMVSTTEDTSVSISPKDPHEHYNRKGVRIAVIRTTVLMGEQCDEAACREHPNTRAQGQTITDADKRRAYPVTRRTQ